MYPAAAREPRTIADAGHACVVCCLTYLNFVHRCDKSFLQNNATLAFLVGSLAILGGYLAILDADLAILAGNLAILGANLAILGAYLAIFDGSLAILHPNLAILDADFAFLSANLAVPRGGVIRTPELGYIIIIMVPDPPLHPLRRPGTLARPQAGGI